MYYRYAVIQVTPKDKDDVVLLEKLMMTNEQVRHWHGD